jgi:rubredoxin
MKKEFSCPQCGHKYPALYLRTDTKCPSCHARVKTDLITIGIFESLAGFPILWVLGTFLKPVLDDSTGVLSYSLLIAPACVLHWYVLKHFANAKVVG